MRGEEGVGAPRLNPPIPRFWTAKVEGVSPSEALIGTAPEEVSGSAPSFDSGSERSGAGSRKPGLRASASEASPREAQGCEVQGHRGVERPTAAYLLRRGRTAATESFAGFPTGRLEGGARPGAGPVMGGATPRSGRCGDSAPDPGSPTALPRSRPLPPVQGLRIPQAAGIACRGRLGQRPGATVAAAPRA